MKNRPRRLRQSHGMRNLVRETRISTESLILPIFLVDGEGIKKEISSLEGQYHYSVDCVCEAIQEGLDKKINKFLLFGLPNHKDEQGSAACHPQGVIQRGLGKIKETLASRFFSLPMCVCASIPAMDIVAFYRGKRWTTMPR